MQEAEDNEALEVIDYSIQRLEERSSDNKINNHFKKLSSHHSSKKGNLSVEIFSKRSNKHNNNSMDLSDSPHFK